MGCQPLALYDNGVVLGTAKVDASGAWSLAIKLAVGTHTLTATQSPAAGITSAPSSPVFVTVPHS
jgi:hypothetical protein